MDQLSSYFPFGFLISRKARDRYEVSDLLGVARQQPSPSEIYAVRVLADRINEGRATRPSGKPQISSGQMMTMGLIVEVLRYVIDRYCMEEHAGSLETGLAGLRKGDPWGVDRSVERFVRFFPPQKVEAGRQSESDFLAGSMKGKPNLLEVVSEVMLLYLSTINPAFEPFRELFDDAELRQQSPYIDLVEGLEDFFNAQPPLLALGQTLFDALRAPMRASPYSLEGQLDYISQYWSAWLPDSLKRRLLLMKDILREETRGRGHVVSSSQVLRFGRSDGLDDGLDDLEAERFSQDRDWMSNVVLMAKSTYVWLDQLSKKYRRAIVRLDEIPDEELDLLARWGFTGLWLIGLWERSPASQRIKQQMGNPEAVSSAYSLYDYVIADDLGGEAAYQDLRERSWRRGIRLASDMVPNHVGIYSRWVIEHPEWFIQRDDLPFPNYRFNGPDLSGDPRVGIFIEDGYWSHTDAAVVFQRVDRWTGGVRYLYHGNDGTHMPWNDTAQLNYLSPEVREAVIQTILQVARKFPIIRFDAAMTLAKRHYQRLWFPRPGEGGAIPSRAEHGMTRERFNAHVPEEFWREVVDRVAKEAPETLLLAEAFWLMEGYFVRTLGMHRVYNSAFMNMLKMEENANYRTTVKNVLEFSPEVLKRFVNFMNNPDERTAVEQFGKGDKYFGVAVMMVTMPGLPMFGHGQIEGYTEKYGMEYRRAYWDEPVDEEMVRRHEAEIFPLMRKRYLFSSVENFALYDFYTPEGHVNEDVFVYSNRAGNERAIILYNNAYNTTRGWIRRSTAINAGKPDSPFFIHKTLAEALSLKTDDRDYWVFRDHQGGLEYIRPARQIAEQGLYAELNAYQYQVFLDFHQIYDADGSWGQLAGKLGGKGVPSMDAAYQEIRLAAILEPFASMINSEMLRSLAWACVEESDAAEAWRYLEGTVDGLLRAAQTKGCPPVPREEILGPMHAGLDFLQRFEEAITNLPEIDPVRDHLLSRVPPQAQALFSFWHIPILWVILRHLGSVFSGRGPEGPGARWMEEWLLTPVVARAFAKLDRDPWQAHLDARLIQSMVGYAEVLAAGTAAEKSARLRAMLDDPAVGDYLHVHRYDGVLWINQEQMESLMYWLLFASVAQRMTDPELDESARKAEILACYQNLKEILSAAEAVGYQVERMLLVFG
ncbi:MAG: alpha-amylase [Nitrospinae bacterium]|nr:alpha-amylase [Nitrospinota bacterium]